MSSTSDEPCDVFSSIGKKLYLSAELADVHFVFKPKNETIVRIPAHKTFLTAASKVFAAMFNDSWKEKNEVQIIDVLPEVFKEFLQFFYLDRVQLTKENVATVMNLANMYDMERCLMVCEKFVKKYIDEDNVCDYYSLSILLNRKGLQSLCETVIGVATSIVLKTNGFQTCDKKTIDSILKLDRLSCSEKELFEACMLWVKAVSKKEILTKKVVQFHLGQSFQEFRFGSMTINEFATLIPSYGKAFSFDEQQDIIQMIANKDFESKMFNRKRDKRCEMNPWKEGKEVIKCKPAYLKESSRAAYYIKNLEVTVFSVNVLALLSGFYFTNIYSNSYNSPQLSVDVTIVRISISTGPSNGEENVLHEGKAQLGVRVGVNQYVLPNPILIIPSFLYEIRLKHKPNGYDQYVTNAPLKFEVKISSDFQVQFHGDSSVKNSLICELTRNHQLW